MATSVKYDGTEILNTTYIPRFVQHESAPDIDMDLVELPNRDGGVIVSCRHNSKRITLSGILTGKTEAQLETNIDNFKELFSRRDKNLDISWAASTRRYVANCVRHTFDRDHFHLLFVPWSAEFVVASGIGEDTSETIIQSGKDFLNETTEAVTFLGTAKPLPRITITPSTTTASCLGLEIKNLDTGQRMVIPVSGGFVANKTIEMDARLRTVKVDGVIVPYFGQFPDFQVGVNNIYFKTGQVIDQGFYDDSLHNAGYAIYNGGIYEKVAQRFTVENTSAGHRRILLYLMKVGSPVGGLPFSIVKDSGGEPSATVVASGSLLGVATSWGWHLENLTDYTLEADTPYWLVLDGDTWGDGSNYIIWGGVSGQNATYKRGHVAYNPGTGWEHILGTDMLFKINYMGTDSTSNANLKIYQHKRYL
jgi:hypothetical protein